MGDVRNFEAFRKRKAKAAAKQPIPLPVKSRVETVEDPGSRLSIDQSENYDWFYSSYPCQIVFDGVVYPSVTHAFHASRKDDPFYRRRVLDARTAADARELGRQVEPEPDWDYQKTAIMENLTRQKFLGDQSLAFALVKTDSSYIKVFDDQDNYWGVNPITGRGLNTLGHILMRIRSELGSMVVRA